MRRISLILTISLVCLAGVTLISSASAGDFADAACSGDPVKLCPTATVGQPYSVEFTLKEPGDGCPTFAPTSGAFPPGLSVASDEGATRGTPTQAGSFTFFITVTYTCGTGGKSPGFFSDQQFTINVNPGTAAPPPAPTVAITTATLPDANINQAYTSPGLTATGGTVTSWALAGGTLPAGLTLGANGVITGTPTQSGLYTFTVQANAGGGSGTKELSMFVIAPLELQTLVNKTPPERGLTAKKLVGVQLKTGVKAVGGRPPYTYTASGTVPPGLTVDSATGAITGTGTTAGRYAFTETVTDGTGATASVEWNITILPLLDFRKGKGLPPGKVGQMYSARIPVRGKDSSTAEFAVAGDIPPGLDVDEDGRLTGRLLEPGVYRLTVYAFPENGSPISKDFRVRVRR